MFGANAINDDASSKVQMQRSEEKEVQLPLLPVEILGEISKWSDSNTKLRLSLVSKKSRHYILVNAQKLHNSRIECICKKIKTILALGQPIDQSTYNLLTCFYLDRCRYQEAREVFEKIEDLNIKSYRYTDFAEYLVPRNNSEETNKFFIEAIAFALSTTNKDSNLGSLINVLIKYRCFLGGKYIIEKVDCLWERTQHSLQLAEEQIAANDLTGANQTLQDIVKWAECMPLSGKKTYRTYDYETFEIIPKSYFLAMIALLQFHCHEIEESRKLLDLATLKANEETTDPLLLSATFAYIADVHLKIGNKEEGFILLEEAKRQASQIADKAKSIHILLGISKLYKNCSEDSHSSDLIKEVFTKANNIEDFDERCSELQKFLRACLEIQKDSHVILDIFSKVKDAAIQARHFIQSQETTPENERQEELKAVDLLLYWLTNSECKISHFKEARNTADLILDPSIQATCLSHIGVSLMKGGFYAEGKKIFQKAIAIYKTVASPSYEPLDPIEIAINSLDEHNCFEEALEIAEEIPALFSRCYRIADLLRKEIERGDLKRALILLNHLPELPDDGKEENISPLLNVAKLMAQKSSPEERDSLSGTISDALDLTDLAKTFAVPLRFHRHYLIHIAIAKAKIGDFLGAQKVLLEAKESFMTDIVEDQKKNADDTITPIRNKKSELIEIAKLQTDLYDFDGALDTIDILNVNPDDYIEALSKIGIRNPKF